MEARRGDNENNVKSNSMKQIIKEYNSYKTEQEKKYFCFTSL